MVLCNGKLIDRKTLDLQLEDINASFPTLKQVREKADSDIVKKALAVTQSNISQAAKLLGISRPTLYELIKSLGLKA